MKFAAGKYFHVTNLIFIVVDVFVCVSSQIKPTEVKIKKQSDRRVTFVQFVRKRRGNSISAALFVIPLRNKDGGWNNVLIAGLIFFIFEKKTNLKKKKINLKRKN